MSSTSSRSPLHYLVPSCNATQKHSIYKCNIYMQVRARSCVQQTRKSDEWLFCALQVCTGAECTGMVPHNFSPLCIFKCSAREPGFCTSCTTSVVQVLCKGTVLCKLHDKCCATTAPPTLLLSCYAFLSKITLF